MSERLSPNDLAEQQKKQILPIDEIKNRESFLINDIGISQDQLNTLKQHKLRLHSVESMNEHLIGLKEREFKNPKKMIKKLPAILGYSFEQIDKRINGLEERGFKNPKKMIEQTPSILGYSLKKIDKKIKNLEKREFKDPKKMIEKFNSVLTCGIKNIDKKIKGLEKRGFKDPKKMIETFPTIIGCNFKNIDKKIKDLEKRGFKNPKEIIERSPVIIGYDINSIDQKIKFLNLINKTYHLNINPITIIESNLSILGTKLNKLFVISRIVRDYQPSPEHVVERIGCLYTTNLESLLVSYTQKEPTDTINNLITNAIDIQKQKITKEDKRKIIKDFFSENQESYKIYRDYLKGYPEKESIDTAA